jgi:exopolyphosphatase/pppGpp-phosphohydrolase
MKKSFVILITSSLLFWSCASQQQKTDPCVERHAVVEYGTSRVKFMVADKNICKKQDLKVLNKTEWELDTNKEISTMPNGQVSFHPSVIENLRKVSKDIFFFSKNFKVKKLHGIATGVYRKLSHRQVTFEELEKIIAGKIQLLTIEEEARMGLLSITSTEKPSGNFVVWDFGGNSMQLSIFNEGQVSVMSGLPGSNFMRTVVMKKLNKKKTPNPIGVKNIPSLEKHLKSKLDSSLLPLTASKDFTVYGIGGVHTKSVASPIMHLLNDPAAKKTYSLEQVEKLLKHLAKSNDLHIGGKFPEDQASNVLAVSMIMKQIGWKTIKVSEQTLALGFLQVQRSDKK